jgi:anti-sigma factor RsiW
MKCQQIETHLMDYIEGTLPPADRKLVELHAHTCSLCAERIQGFAGVSALLDSWESVEVSPAFNLRLQQRLREEPAAHWWNGGWSGFLPRLMAVPLASPVFAVALFLMVSVAAVMLRYSPTEPQTLARQESPFVQTVAASGVDDISLYRNLPMLEDMDVLRNFDVLQELGDSRQQ